MKTFLLSAALSVLLLFTNSLSAQNLRTCGHDDVLNAVRSTTPDFDAQYDLIYEQARNWAAANRNEDTTYTIQVVFHVLYEANDPYQYISDELIHSQLEALNRDFNKRNADTSETRDVFKPLAGNAKVNFVLAKKIGDQCKNGIIRKQWNAPAAFIPIFMDFLVKDNLPGGSSAWNTEKYLNIWVCNLNKNSDGQGYLGGYAYLPGLVETGLANRHDGVVIDFRFFGQDNPWVAEIEPGFSLYTEGRTTVHEVGHWLGLRHIWGDLGTLIPEQGCDADDGVDDTPNARQPYSVHGFCEDTIVNSCDDGVGDLPDMFENYMDYSTDECNSMFTHGQVDVIRFTLSDYRNATQHEYDYPASSRITASVDEGESIELGFEIEECFGYSSITTSFNGDDSTYTSDLGTAQLISDETGFNYNAGTYREDNVDAFYLSVYDHHHNQADTVYVEITVNDVMDTVSTGIVLVDSESNGIEIFPNPSSGLVTVAFSRAIDQSTLRVYSPLGDQVEHFELPHGIHRFPVDLTAYPSGVYILGIESKGELTFEKLLVE